MKKLFLGFLIISMVVAFSACSKINKIESSASSESNHSFSDDVVYHSSNIWDRVPSTEDVMSERLLDKEDYSFVESRKNGDEQTITYIFEYKEKYKYASKVCDCYYTYYYDDRTKTWIKGETSRNNERYTDWNLDGEYSLYYSINNIEKVKEETLKIESLGNGEYHVLVNYMNNVVYDEILSIDKLVNHLISMNPDVYTHIEIIIYPDQIKHRYGGSNVFGYFEKD